MEQKAPGLTEALDFESDVPVYEQIRQRITFAIGREAFHAGSKLPSVRALARSLTVNPNTVIRVYRELEQEGLIRTKRGVGVFVTEKAADVCRQDRVTIVADKLKEALDLAKQADMSTSEIENLWLEARKHYG